jgi:hypothetical protein
VPVAVRVHARITGQRRTAVAEHPVTLDLPSGTTTASVFLEAVVRAEVSAYQARAEERTFFRVLTERSLEQGLESGRVLSGGQDPVGPVDVDAAVAEALLAFEDGFFKVFVGDDEVESLSQEVRLTGDVEVLFLRLVPLAGG